MLTVENLLVTKDGVPICAVPELRIAEGEKVAVTGLNGSGKTTLLRVIGGLESDYSGTVTMQARSRVYVHQAPYLFRGTVASNVEYGLANQRKPKSERQASVAIWLDRFEIAHLAHTNTRVLSGGERRRVALARAFAMEPQLLLLDEPFADLDSSGMDTVRQTIQSVTRSTILITSPVASDFLPIRSYELKCSR